ncbi:MAG: MBL fold metallo-hydrolase [Candidatus Bathyarchaeia archaeon]|jgi:glyoxylase-like metal-dependent hydrolase (beta-lactamase superfamily II)
MNVEIFPFSLGFNDCYVIRDQGVILIDAGVPGKKTDFVRAMKSIRMEPQDIKLNVITHGHPDHMGSAKDIKEITRARIAMHQLDKVCLETGEWNTTGHRLKGTGLWSSIAAGMSNSIVALRHSKVATCAVDVTIDDTGADLANYGIHGQVVYTPGHTIGSLSVLLDSGEAFVGDLAMNKLPLRHNPGLPVFVDDMEKVKESWRKLLKLGVRTVYPGHGKPFSVEVIEKALK